MPLPWQFFKKTPNWRDTACRTDRQNPRNHLRGGRTFKQPARFAPIVATRDKASFGESGSYAYNVKEAKQPEL